MKISIPYGDIQLKITDNGKLQAIFPESGQKDYSLRKNNKGCSVTISDPSSFGYCTQKDGAYELSGDNVTFDGTDKGDKLVLNNVNDSKINMGGGDDTVSIKGSSSESRFRNNVIKTGDGDDTVVASGDFSKTYGFYGNQIYLGKGSDYFSASINPDDDAKTYTEFESKSQQYGRTVAKNEIYAIDGYTGDGDKKGWFENNVFESKTYSANQFFKYDASSGAVSGADGFDTYNFKPEPKSEVKYTPPKKEVQPEPAKEDSTKSKKSTEVENRDKYSSLYSNGSFRAMLYGDGKGQTEAIEALDKYTKSMTK